MPYTSAANETAASGKAEEIRAELARQIPNRDRLFQ
jgi:hypothetical protein